MSRAGTGNGDKESTKQILRGRELPPSPHTNRYTLPVISSASHTTTTVSAMELSLPFFKINQPMRYQHASHNFYPHTSIHNLKPH